MHSDIWEPAPYLAKHGFKYILTFIDDYSRRIFCYLLGLKMNFFLNSNFVNFIERQRQINKRDLVDRTDNGLEFCKEKCKIF